MFILFGRLLLTIKWIFRSILISVGYQYLPNEVEIPIKLKLVAGKHAMPIFQNGVVLADGLRRRDIPRTRFAQFFAL
jgi:hypothetical protein